MNILQKMILVFVCLSAAVLSADEILLKTFRKEIFCGSSKNNQIQLEHIKGGARVTVKKRKDSEQIDPTHIQLVCAYKPGLKAETSYKVTFTVKASRGCRISGGVIGDRKPWTYFVRKWYILTPDKPRTESIEFTPEADTGAIRTPCLFLGELPVGTVFTITDVKLYKIQQPETK